MLKTQIYVTRPQCVKRQDDFKHEGCGCNNLTESSLAESNRASSNSTGCCKTQTYLLCTEFLYTSDTLLESICVETREARGWLRSILAMIWLVCLLSSSSFYWHYNPIWVLAFTVILFHPALSLHWFLHRLIPIICLSSSISAINLFLGLPLILVPIGLVCLQLYLK